MNHLPDSIRLLPALAAITLPLLVIGYFAVKLATHSRRVKKTTGGQTMIGLTGRAESAISPDGLVFVRGELWHARAAQAIQAGARVRVIGFSQLALVVEPEVSVKTL